jgi:exoribonuclease-2
MRKVRTLEEIANQVMEQRGFLAEFSKEALAQAASIQEPASALQGAKDLRDLLWVSIDNEESKDLDQITYAEKDKIFVGVADVDGLIKKNTFIDRHAAHNTTSIYTPTKIFPMLPVKFSNDLTSLNENKERTAIVVEISVAEDGKFDLIDLYPALVRNKAKLNYPCIGNLLEHNICKHPIPSIPYLREQLFLQDELSQKIQSYRDKQGALEFGVVQLHAVTINGVPVEIQEQKRSRAHKLIENYMIAANVCTTRFLKDIPTIRRVVKTPKNWPRIVDLAKELGGDLPQKPNSKALRRFLLEQREKFPLQFPDLSLSIIKLLGRGEYVLAIPGKSDPSHFNLAEDEYAHTTAPNRRFPDLIMQRLLKAHLLREVSPYNLDELQKLALRCTQKEADSDKLERQLLKCAAAIILQKEVGKVFTALVTGSSPKGTWVRVSDPPIEGKLIKGFEKAEVGDFLKVKLSKVDPLKGHIDFIKQV